MGAKTEDGQFDEDSHDVYIPLVRSDNQKVSWPSFLILSQNPFVLTFTGQQAALKSLAFHVK